MADLDRKLSPAEFLAELKSQTMAAADSMVAPAAEVSSDVFDFSDIPATGSADSSPSNTGGQTATLDPPAGFETGFENEPQVHEQHDQNATSVDGDNPDEGQEEELKQPIAMKRNSRLTELFDRVNNLLGDAKAGADTPFLPRTPETLQETGLTPEEIERLVLKYLMMQGSASGRQISAQVRLPYKIVEPLLKQWKNDQFIGYKGAAEVGDYIFVITEIGRERARRYSQECTYFGAAPVSVRDYLYAMERQSIAKQHATEKDLKAAFSDLLIPEELMDRLGPAVNSGRGMFLFGEPGNGKTSIAERITRSFGSTIWIPRALGIDGDIIRLFDPGVHEPVEHRQEEGIFDLSGVDQRWVEIVRPTVIAGGELTMTELEVAQNSQTKICEAPLQLKSNCGTLVIDDFGRQRMPVDELLNRWIVPLEKRYDFLNLPSGKKIQLPFDQLIVFSTNLEPKDLVDGAFLRRIPYKIEVGDPSRDHFVKLFEIMAPKFGFEFNMESVDYLIQKHYVEGGREFRACHPRDLLLQVRNFCAYKEIQQKMTPQGFDFAVENYFSVM